MDNTCIYEPHGDSSVKQSELSEREHKSPWAWQATVTTKSVVLPGEIVFIQSYVELTSEKEKRMSLFFIM